MAEDKIRIFDLVVQAVVGVNPSERTKKQNIVVNLTLFCDLRACGFSDSIHDTLNYSTITKQVIKFIEEEQAFTLERLATGIARLCLLESTFSSKVNKVKVRVDKPGVLNLARLSFLLFKLICSLLGKGAFS